MAQLPCSRLYKPCTKLPFGDCAMYFDYGVTEKSHPWGNPLAALTAKRASACPLAAARCKQVRPRISWINLSMTPQGPVVENGII